MGEGLKRQDSRAVIGWNGYFGRQEQAGPLLVVEDDGQAHAMDLAEVSTKGLGHIVTTPPRVPTPRESAENETAQNNFTPPQQQAVDTSIFLG